MRAATQADRLHYKVRQKRPPVVWVMWALLGIVLAPITSTFPLTGIILMLLWITFVFVRERRATEQALLRDRREIKLLRQK
jgi:hypothetical protein